MARKHPNPRYIRLNRSYTTKEISILCGVHIHTIAAWRKAGLKAIDANRPALFLGSEIRRYLLQQRTHAKQPCLAGQGYCLRCKTPRYYAGFEVTYIPRTPRNGDLRGQCGVCGTTMYRRTNFLDVRTVAAGLHVKFGEDE